MTQQHDMVNHPPHYTSHLSGVECIDVVEHMCFNLGNAVKYIWRADLKGADLQDLEKARWYVDREIKKRRREHEWARIKAAGTSIRSTPSTETP